MANDNLIKDLYWAAGFIEGEGSFTAYKASIGVRADQVQKEPLDRLQRIFGGTVYLRQHPSRANVQPIHAWNISGKTAAGVMMTLFKLMSPRRQEQINIALSKWRIIPVGVRSKYSDICKRGHGNRWGRLKYMVKSGESRIGRRCLECHRLRANGVLK